MTAILGVEVVHATNLPKLDQYGISVTPISSGADGTHPELGWKDTVRISPLQDIIVALRPIIPYVPFELPNGIRLLNTMMPAGSEAMFNNFDANGNPTTPIVNQLVNFGWQYVYHCHILSHGEMDTMRPVSVTIPPLRRMGSHIRSAGRAETRYLQ